ncbi:K(+)/H(+) antiporter NhaP2 [Candidatus Bilamarchaeum dharawalense]|uniref:K(+)/H(+) antiporter NhaP2 n=1 Tax=Candidatus Bilamarchaeum dharawalense TaxID=2885759 RepID=A0A5E4LRP8_9ARCH|nr:K(+)/H(+) antiporter NhaP2 [Candidatus Bilamarchaeum dharawalense]
MYELFFVLGLTIFAGFLATAIFERVHISQVILLMAFGFLLGPIFHIIDVSEGSIIVSIMPFVATLALIVLLFDAGLMIDIFSVAKAIPKGTLFTFLVFILGLIFVTAFTAIALAWPILHGVLLGAVVGGTSSAIVITMVEKIKIGRETKSLLTVESTITDALCIIVAVLVIQLIVTNQALEPGVIVNLLLSSFSLAVLVGCICAIAWVFLIQKFSVTKYAYMLTLALVFGVYAITEAVKANGGFAVFVFGLVLGNSRELGKLLNLDVGLTVNPTIQLFQEEITFFVRTFFFVYIGLLFSLTYFTQQIVAVSTVLIVIFLIARWVGQKITLGDLPVKDRNIVISVLPRGLAAAVLATMPLTNGIMIQDFQPIAFGVILLSNIVATLGIFVFDK